jgi:hypothetical protein
MSWQAGRIDPSEICGDAASVELLILSLASISTGQTNLLVLPSPNSEETSYRVLGMPPRKLRKDSRMPLYWNMLSSSTSWNVVNVTVVLDCVEIVRLELEESETFPMGLFTYSSFGDCDIDKA